MVIVIGYLLGGQYFYFVRSYSSTKTLIYGIELLLVGVVISLAVEIESFQKLLIMCTLNMIMETYLVRI